VEELEPAALKESATVRGIQIMCTPRAINDVELDEMNWGWNIFQ